MKAENKPIYARAGLAYISSDLAAAQLDLALATEDIKAFITELGQIIKARGGYARAARTAGLQRTSLYKIVSTEGNPTLNTLLALLTPLGLRLSIEPIAEKGVQCSAALEFNADAPRDTYAGDSISSEE